MTTDLSSLRLGTRPSNDDWIYNHNLISEFFDEIRGQSDSDFPSADLGRLVRVLVMENNVYRNKNENKSATINMIYAFLAERMVGDLISQDDIITILNNSIGHASCKCMTASLELVRQHIVMSNHGYFVEAAIANATNNILKLVYPVRNKNQCDNLVPVLDLLISISKMSSLSMQFIDALPFPGRTWMFPLISEEVLIRFIKLFDTIITRDKSDSYKSFIIGEFVASHLVMFKNVALVPYCMDVIIRDGERSCPQGCADWHKKDINMKTMAGLIGFVKLLKGVPYVEPILEKNVHCHLLHIEHSK